MLNIWKEDTSTEGTFPVRQSTSYDFSC